MATPPKAVSLNSAGIPSPTLYIAERASSKGIFEFTPAITKSAVQRAFIAPDTFLVSVKVLDKSGNGKIENVVEAAGWIIENKSAMNIRVVNISFGTRAKMELSLIHI